MQQHHVLLLLSVRGPEHAAGRRHRRARRVPRELHDQHRRAEQKKAQANVSSKDRPAEADGLCAGSHEPDGEALAAGHRKDWEDRPRRAQGVVVAAEQAKSSESIEVLKGNL